MMSGCILKEAPCLECFLGLKLNLDLKMNLYICFITKDA